MLRLNAWKMAGVVFALFATTAIVSPAQVFTKLVDFNGHNGTSPLGSLVQGPDGNMYGTTEDTVFKISPEGRLTTGYTFCSQPNCTDGTALDAGVILATDANFYGTTQLYGSQNCRCGTVFKITSQGSLTTIHSFDNTDGADPEAALVQATSGNFYGTTTLGGGTGCSGFGCGTIFEITPTGELTTLYYFCSQFNCVDGAEPRALVQASDGNFYGTTGGGGEANAGTVFKVTPGGSLATLYSFCAQTNCTDGGEPFAGLVQGTDGSFYGTTVFGGANGYGTVFKVTSGGSLTTLYSFCAQINCTDGRQPYADLIQAADGNFYGVTGFGGADDLGTVFEITPGGTLTTLHSFESNDGAVPTGGLLQHTNGTFYGTALREGTHYDGTVFSLSTGLGPFVSFVRNPARVGQTFGVLGQGFKGTTGVSLNGVTASFTVRSETLLTVKVPAGATTGFVTVTMPSGTLTSNVPFRVIQ